MTHIARSDNEAAAKKFPAPTKGLFRSRDIFLHDGSGLRRITIAPALQIAVLLAAGLLLAWSAVAAVKIAGAATVTAEAEAAGAGLEAGLAAAIAREADERARRIEQRQAFLAALIAGETDAEGLAALLPEEAGSGDKGWAARAVAGSFANAEQGQLLLIERAEEMAKARYEETADIVRGLGLNPARFHRGQGGPFEAVRPLENADPRFRQLFMSWNRVGQLEQGTIAIPSLMPVEGVRLTSGFGVRSDPFRRRAAMHAGIDLAGPVGTPIYATADGVVNRSQYAGAYGNLVEINHGQGIQTRYAHLSRRIAEPGQRVKRGDLIGLMGSTGRSTGSHLHYEVRIDGRAVNPTPFMRGNETLLAVQRRATGTETATAMGGPESGAR